LECVHKLPFRNEIRTNDIRIERTNDIRYTIHETIQYTAGVLGVKQNLTFCENGSLCTHSNFFRVKNKINCALTIHKQN
jgi:exo-beta-1,3-glucanase (GH17 family)